ncbi:hypothetical protein WME76_35530 [Sorangium sp. So ce119]|uniref:hypothetical protein n=1 Tax=Sorangium sp. So ce119 TaxID=3133279 RepID=UPI003F632BCC
MIGAIARTGACTRDGTDNDIIARVAAGTECAEHQSRQHRSADTAVLNTILIDGASANWRHRRDQPNAGRE